MKHTTNSENFMKIPQQTHTRGAFIFQNLEKF